MAPARSSSVATARVECRIAALASALAVFAEECDDGPEPALPVFAGDTRRDPLMDGSEPQYTPSPGEAQLSARAVIAGCITGSVVACTNIYIGLKIGWTFGASIIAAVLSFAMFAVLGRRLTVLETNIAQTA